MQTELANRKQVGFGERLLDSLGRDNLYETTSALRGLDYLRSGSKRELDLWGSRVMLVCGAGELVGVAAATIALANRFPPFVKIEGPNGTCRWKLQTMLPGAQGQEVEFLAKGEALNGLKDKGDGRVTRTGKIIRKISIDELPTLFDVAAGRMHLVGPKMLTRDEYRHHILPSVTAEPYFSYVNFLEKEGVKYGFLGPYILHGRNGPYLGRVAADVEYCQKTSLRADYRLIILNALAVLVYRGK